MIRCDVTFGRTYFRREMIKRVCRIAPKRLFLWLHAWSTQSWTELSILHNKANSYKVSFSLAVDHQSLTPETVASMLSYPVTLPTFSSSVQYALENGYIHSGKMWSQFCKECSQFYQPLLDIYEKSAFHDSKTSSVVYQSIGRSMYEKYPCIAGKGIRPWVRNWG